MRRAPVQIARALFLEDLGAKIFSLFLGLSAWAWIQSETLSETTIKISIDYTSSDELSLAEVPRQSVSAIVRGAQGKLRNVEDTQLYANINLNDFSQGRHTYEFNISEIKGLAEGVELLRLSPPSVDIELDQEITKEIPLEPNLVGVTKEGWTLLSKKISPSSITLSGPQKLLSNIDTIKTDPISIENITGEASFQTAPFLPELLRVKSKQNITVELNLVPLSNSKLFEQIPVLVRSPFWKSKAQDVNLTLKGPTEELKELKAERLTLVLLPSNSEQPELTLNFSEDEAPFQLSHNGSKNISLIAVDPPTITLTQK
jgi:YbbR domain-containing protein